MVKKLGVDLSEYLANSTPSVIDFDNAIVVKIEGYKNHREYYADVSCYRRLNDMKIPTFFFRARDEPVVDNHRDMDTFFTSNPNIFLGCTKYGGHGAFNKHFWSYD